MIFAFLLYLILQILVLLDQEKQSGVLLKSIDLFLLEQFYPNSPAVMSLKLTFRWAKNVLNVAESPIILIVSSFLVMLVVSIFPCFSISSLCVLWQMV